MVGVGDTDIRAGGRPAKDALFEALTTVARALSSGRRAEIVELLAQGARSVDEIATQIDQSVANTSHHLRTLAHGGLVATHREGTRVIYRLADPKVFELWYLMRAVASDRVADLERIAGDYLGDRSRLETVTRRQLTQMLESGQAVVVDVRPEEEYHAGHIPGAISIPIDQLDQRLAELPTTTHIVAYCRGPYCVYADQAVRRLDATGHTAHRLEEGYPEWERSRHQGTGSDDTDSSGVHRATSP